MLDCGFIMRFVTFEHNGRRHGGVVQNDHVISLEAAGYPDLLSLLQGGAEGKCTLSWCTPSPRPRWLQ
jgi:hypothetical protein